MESLGAIGRRASVHIVLGVYWGGGCFLYGFFFFSFQEFFLIDGVRSDG